MRLRSIWSAVGAVVEFDTRCYKIKRKKKQRKEIMKKNIAKMIWHLNLKKSK